LKWLIGLLVFLSVPLYIFGQPIERPPRPGEDIPAVEKSGSKPVVDRETRGRKESLKPLFVAEGGYAIPEEATWAQFSAGTRRDKLSIALSVAYFDYSRNFVGTQRSYMGSGNYNISEKGSFVHSNISVGYDIKFKGFLITPRCGLGYADIVTRRWDADSLADTTRFIRSRLTNSFGFGIAYPLGKMRIGAAVEWFVINPWFYFYPEDFGLIKVGFTIGI